MAKLIVLGSCAGTEPMTNRQHTSLVIEAGGSIYWFDAGEGCSRTAHLMGVDLLRVRAIFISHPHMDHIGGLANLLWTIRKLAVRTKTNVTAGRIDLFYPELRSWEGMLQMLRYTEGNFSLPFALEAMRPCDGLVYEDENIRVIGMHNGHMADSDAGEHVSYSYRIETQEKSVVFSGDLRAYTEIEPLIGKGCDYLLMETGHHSVKAICDFSDAQPVGQLIFVHHGREMLEEGAQVHDALAACTRMPLISRDGMVLEL